MMMPTSTAHLLFTAGAREVTTLLILTAISLLAASHISLAYADMPPQQEAQAPALERALLHGEVVLKGPQSSHQTIFELHEPSTLSIVVAGATSEVASPERSTISVWIDDIPVQTKWISRIAEPDETHRWQLVAWAGRLEQGFHRVRIQSILHNDQDPCFQRQPEEAWTRLDKLTLFASERALEPSRSLANFPSMWARRDQGALTEGEKTPHISVRMRSVPSQPDALQAYLHADTLIRQLGYTPVLEIGDFHKKGFYFSQMEASRGASFAGALELALIEDGDPFTHLSLEQDRVRVEAYDWSGVEIGLNALQRPSLLAHCAEGMASACAVHALHDQEVEEGSGKSTLDDPASRVQSLSTLGFRHGWIAQEIGEHVLQTSWRRPKNWKITSPPTYIIKLHTSMTKRWIDVSSSALHLSLNGIPLEQFPVHKLDQRAPGEALLKVRIPPQFWDEDVWTFKLTVVLREAPRLEITTQCARVHQGQAWLRLEPDSGLWVPRDVHHHHGLSTFAHGEPPVISWTHGLSIDHVEALGALLYPLVIKHGALKVVRPEVCAQARCIAPMLHDPRHLQGAQSLPEPFDVKMTSRGPGLLDKSGTYNLPVLPAQRTILLDYIRTCADERPCERLSIWMPTQLEALHAISAPDYAQVQGHQALHVHGMWHLSPLQGEVREIKHVKADAWSDISKHHIKGLKEERRYLINVLWIMAVLMSCVAVFLYFKRRAHANPMKDFDPRGYEDLEIHKPK